MPIDPQRLKYHLETIGYDKTKTDYLVKGSTNGFRINHIEELNNTCSKNDPAIEKRSSIAQQKVNNEVATGGEWTLQNPTF